MAQNGFAQKVDMGKVTASGQAQLFINALGIGFDAMVATKANKLKEKGQERAFGLFV